MEMVLFTIQILLGKLNKVAIQQLKILEKDNNLEQLKTDTIKQIEKL